MSREKKLIKNTTIYLVGNIFSKALSFLLLPLYTSYLNQADMGGYDLIFNSVTIAVSIFSIGCIEAILRFSLDAKTETELNKVFTNCLLIILFGAAFSVGVFIIIGIFIKVQNVVIIVLFFLSTMFFSVWQQMARSLQKNLLYALSGVIFSAIMLISNIILIVFLRMHIEALILSQIIANFSIVFFLEFKLHLLKMLKPGLVQGSFMKVIIKYSAPLLPNAINWWIMNSSNRFIITGFLGIQANGIFSVASKFPFMISNASQLFNKAWTESAIIENEAEDKDVFYTKIFSFFMNIQFAFLILLLVTVKFIIKIMVDDSFGTAWLYIPFLLIGTMFSSFSGFFGSAFVSAKKTKGSFYSSIFGAVTNVIINILLIKLIGLQAASISNAIAFLVMWIARVKMTRKFFKIRIDYKRFASYSCFIAILLIGYYMNKIYIDLLMLFASSIAITIFNKNFIQKGILIIKNKQEWGKLYGS